MKVAITGGTGFVGRHLAHALVDRGHGVVLIARGRDRRAEEVRRLPGVRCVPADVGEVEQLVEAFAGCDTVAHCAGINREIGRQTYQRVHVEGTRNVVEAAKATGVRKVVLLSFLRARPDCGSAYHESKWAAEELMRSSGLDYTVIKAGLIYGKGDHLLDHLSHALHTLPVFAVVGMKGKPIRPTSVTDVVRILRASLVEGRLSRQTVGVIGPEELTLDEVVRRVARVLSIRPLIGRVPVAVHYALAWCGERLMTIPLISIAQVRMLAEGMVEPSPACDVLPDDLRPQTRFTDQEIRRGVPEGKAFGLRDLRWFG